ncbi:MAG: hypothetical protein R3C45_09880 [Phycisphaerales bacterium]
MNDQEAPKQMSGCAKAAIGCGIATLILLIILALGAWYVARNAKAWAAGGFASVVNQAVEQSTLPDEQKKTITSRVDHIKDEFVAGNITLEQIGQAMENLNVENLIAAGFTQYVGSGIIESSQLSDDDKAVGKQAMNRVATGVLDGNISTQQIEQVLAPIMQQTGSDNWEFKQNPTPEELQQVMENANDLADKAGIPQDVEQVDFGKRVEEAFDEALGTP